MELNKNNWFARYYNWMYGELPQDICTFFWGTLSAILFIPVLLPGRVITERYDDTSKKVAAGMLSWFLVFLFFLVGAIFWIIYDEKALDGLPIYLQILTLIGSGLVVLSIIGGICYSIYLLQQRIKVKRQQKYEEDDDYQPLGDKISNFVGAIRQKHCTKITWKTNKIVK